MKNSLAETRQNLEARDPETARRPPMSPCARCNGSGTEPETEPVKLSITGGEHMNDLFVEWLREAVEFRRRRKDDEDPS